MAIEAAQKLAAQLGASQAEGTFKCYRTVNPDTGETRSHILLKCANIAFTPAVDLSFDLPGDSDALFVQAANFGIGAALGNEQPKTP